MTRRVLQIVGSLADDGEGRAMALVAAALDRSEFDVHVCAIAAGPLAAVLESAGIAHGAMARRTGPDGALWWRLRQAIFELRPQLIHVWPSAGAIGQLAALAAGRARVIVGQRAPCANEAWHRPLGNRLAAARASALVVDSPAVARLWRERAWPEQKIHVIPPGIPLADVAGPARRELLAELKLPPNARLIVAAGPLELRERVKDLIWATDLLKVIRDDVHLLVIGEGPHRARLERYARLCQIRDKVHFVGTCVTLSRVLPHVDVFWRGSGQAGLPWTVGQALAAAVPAVVADAPGIAELVAHEQTGFIVPLGDRAGFARCANKVLDQNALARRLGAAGRQRIATQFTTQAMVERHAAVYREVSG
jgi:glycosyltransferase involved in cell wall biosynthesis